MGRRDDSTARKADPDAPERLDLDEVPPELRENLILRYLAEAPDEELRQLDELAQADRELGVPDWIPDPDDPDDDDR